MTSSIPEIRERLPIAYVLYQHGVEVTPGLRLVLCPFHDDGTASFSIFNGEKDNLERWGCFGCASGGTVLDLIMKFAGDDKLTHAHVEQASELLEEYEGSNWEPPPPPERRIISPEAMHTTVTNACTDPDLSVIQTFIDYKREQTKCSWLFDAAWLVENFGVGTMTPNQLIIPVYTAKGLHTYKFWTRPQDKRMTAAGTRFGADIFYTPNAEDDLSLPVLICEGESDTWNAWYFLSERVFPYGVLAGAAMKPVGLERFRGRTVYLAFDGDRPGRKAAETWTEALYEIAAEVLIVPIAPDKDISTTASVEHALDNAKAPMSRPKGISETPGGYGRSTDHGVSDICNWGFEPRKQLKGEEGTAYEGLLKPGGTEVVLSSMDLLSNNRLKRWSQRLGRSWWGSERDGSLLLAYLQADSSFLPTGELVGIAGLHRGQYVWPGGMIGNDYIRYAPPLLDAHIEDSITIEESEWSVDELHLLRSINKNRAADPILAWLAAAPLRPLFKAFPLLTITGVFGSGKTQTTEVLIHRFSGSSIQGTFAATSPHALSLLVAATNAFPVHMDEYSKIGTRSDTIDAFSAYARNAYTAQKSYKGGARENVSELVSITPSAPIVVTGEHTFTEGALSDRMVFLRMHKKKQNYDAFVQLQKMGQTGLSHAYLSWLNKKINQPGFKEWLNDEQPAPGELSSRQRWNYHVLVRGWELLQQFVVEHGGELSEPYFEEVRGEWRRANANNPLDRALRDALRDPQSGVKAAGEMMTVRLGPFRTFLRNNHIPMPGGADAIERDLIDRYDGTYTEGDGHQTVIFKATSLIANETK